VGKGQEQRAKRFEAVVAAVEEKRRAVNAAKLKLQALSGLQGDVRNFRQRVVADWLAEVKEARSEAGLADSDWSEFGVTFTGDVNALLEARIRTTQSEIKKLEGLAPTDPLENPQADPAIPLIAEGVDLSTQSLHLLQRERDRLQRLIGVDDQNARRYKQLSDKISKAETTLGKIAAEIERAGKADEVIKTLREQRHQAYQGFVDAVIDEERELDALYAPLKERIAVAQGALSKLSFSIRRIVDLTAWTERGEALLDLRTGGPFRGKGELRRAVEARLANAWLRGSAADVSSAMSEFLSTHTEQLKQHKPAQANFREWARNVAAWLYSTDHVQVGYGLQYDGVDIEQLSPGTRGVVLLLLYLAIDAEDDRPLIIDQPEENLDPQSVFDELVQQFREAKKRRQIIIVTHNANLVVNTDVDQVIVARCGLHRRGQLPEISYESSGLENASIRSAVCATLEGGERAFRERARRLRIAI
jgi:DNA repair exonuclease SbcCD ATPase subunit